MPLSYHVPWDSHNMHSLSHVNFRLLYPLLSYLLPSSFLLLFPHPSSFPLPSPSFFLPLFLLLLLLPLPPPPPPPPPSSSSSSSLSLFLPPSFSPPPPPPPPFSSSSSISPAHGTRRKVSCIFYWSMPRQTLMLSLETKTTTPTRWPQLSTFGMRCYEL